MKPFYVFRWLLALLAVVVLNGWLAADWRATIFALTCGHGTLVGWHLLVFVHGSN